MENLVNIQDVDTATLHNINNDLVAQIEAAREAGVDCDDLEDQHTQVAGELMDRDEHVALA